MSVHDLNDKFFESIQKHSIAKLQIYENYVVPWMRKIVLGTKDKKCLIIDGFAGPGDYNGHHGSPILLLKAAIDFYEQAEKHKWSKPEIFILLVEENKENYLKLLSNIKEFSNIDIKDEQNFYSSNERSSIYVKCVNTTFDIALTDLLAIVKDEGSLIPSLCFLDPFGWSHTPFKIISSYLKNENAEFILNFMYEEANRFLTHRNQKIKGHFKELLGTDNLEELIEQVKKKSAAERKQIITDFYSRQILEHTDADYVLNFDIKKQGRVKMIIFYGTKNQKGLKLMKEVMWKLDDTGAYMFDDRVNLEQIEFTFANEMTKLELLDRLSKKILNNFKGRKAVDIELVEEFVITETEFPIPNYLKPSLKLLEEGNEISNIRKVDGSQRRKGTYNCVLIDFK